MYHNKAVFRPCRNNLTISPFQLVPPQTDKFFIDNPGHQCYEYLIRVIHVKGRCRDKNNPFWRFT